MQIIGEMLFIPQPYPVPCMMHRKPSYEFTEILYDIFSLTTQLSADGDCCMWLEGAVSALAINNPNRTSDVFLGIEASSNPAVHVDIGS